MTNIPSKQINTTRRPDCVTEARVGNTVLIVFGCFKRDTSDNKKAKIWRPRSAGGTSSTRPGLMLRCGKVAQDNFVELTAAPAIPNNLYRPDSAGKSLFPYSKICGIIHRRHIQRLLWR